MVVVLVGVVDDVVVVVGFDVEVVVLACVVVLAGCVVVVEGRVVVLVDVVVAPLRITSPTEVLAAGGVEPVSAEETGLPSASSRAVRRPRVRANTKRITAKSGQRRPEPDPAMADAGGTAAMAGPSLLHGDATGSIIGGANVPWGIGSIWVVADVAAGDVGATISRTLA